MPTTPVANLKIKLDGEKEYKAAVSEINATLRRLDSELKKTDAQFADNADSIEALSQKHGTLSEKVTAQEKKVDELRKAFSKAEEIQKAANKSFEETASTLDKSSDEYAEMVEQLRKANMQADKWATSLNNAEAELAKMQGTLDENTAALESAKNATEQLADATDDVGGAASSVQQPLGGVKATLDKNNLSAQGLGSAITDIAGKFGVQLPDGAAKAAEALNGINAGAALAVTGVGLLAAAIVKTEKAMISMTKKAAAYADNILTLSMTTGQTTDQLQEFDYAAELIDVSIDTLQGSLTKLTNNMQNAAAGTGDAQEAFSRLGVSIVNADGSLRSANDVFYDTVDALGDVTNATERDALAMDIFGRSAQDLNPLIIQGSKTLKAYADEAHNVGYVLDEEALTALGAVDDAYQRLQKTQEGVQNQMAEEFSPYLTEFYEKATKLIKDGGTAMQNSGLVEAFGMLLETFTNLISPTDELSGEAVPKLTEALRPLAELLAMISDAIEFISGAGKVIFNNFWDKEWSEGWSQMATAAGLNYSKGKKSRYQTIHDDWTAWDTNAETERNGYGAYYVNGIYYASKDAYLRELWEKDLNSGEPTPSFEAWKQIHGYTTPGNASGTDYWYGGRTLVGENGPEELVLPRGSQITSASETRYRSVKSVYVDKIIIDAKNVKEFNDIVQIMLNERISSRMEAK